VGVIVLSSSHRLRGGAHDDLVERHALRPADGEGDDVGDVLRGMPMSAVASSAARLLSAWVMWSASSVAMAPGSMTVTRMSGSGSTRRASDHPLIPQLVAALAAKPPGATRAATEETFDEVAPAVAELVEEDLGDRHRAEQVGLDHAPVLFAPGRGDGRRPHDPGVVDEDAGGAQLPLTRSAAATIESLSVTSASRWRSRRRRARRPGPGCGPRDGPAARPDGRRRPARGPSPRRCPTTRR
jgi:hypothetical protein